MIMLCRAPSSAWGRESQIPHVWWHGVMHFIQISSKFSLTDLFSLETLRSKLEFKIQFSICFLKVSSLLNFVKKIQTKVAFVEFRYNLFMVLLYSSQTLNSPLKSWGQKARHEQSRTYKTHKQDFKYTESEIPEQNPIDLRNVWQVTNL